MKEGRSGRMDVLCACEVGRASVSNSSLAVNAVNNKVHGELSLSKCEQLTHTLRPTEKTATSGTVIYSYSQ